MLSKSRNIVEQKLFHFHSMFSFIFIMRDCSFLFDLMFFISHFILFYRLDKLLFAMKQQHNMAMAPKVYFMWWGSREMSRNEVDFVSHFFSWPSQQIIKKSSSESFPNSCWASKKKRNQELWTLFANATRFNARRKIDKPQTLRQHLKKANYQP